jgi:hypothetical protein
MVDIAKRTVVLKGIPPKRCPVVIRVPIHDFAEYLAVARKSDLKYPALDQVRWLLRHWQCDDVWATYVPPDDPTAERTLEIAPAFGPFSSWWREISRN